MDFPIFQFIICTRKLKVWNHRLLSEPLKHIAVCSLILICRIISSCNLVLAVPKARLKQVGGRKETYIYS